MKKDKTRSNEDTNLDNTTQPCLVCGHKVGNIAGTKDAICTNCGFKDACCN